MPSHRHRSRVLCESFHREARSYWLKCLVMINNPPVGYYMTIKGRYNFDLIERHSNQLALDCRRVNRERFQAVKSSLSFLGQIIDEIGNEPKTHQRNVRMTLATRFFNHLYSQLILTQRGLFLDAANASRSATETTAFYWLVCLDADSAKLYDAESSPRPVEIRKKLEDLDIDVSELQDIYKHQSEVAHVGNTYDNLQIRWGANKDGQLLVGGGSEPETQRRSLNAIVAAMMIFLKYDPNYEVVNKNDRPET